MNLHTEHNAGFAHAKITNARITCDVIAVPGTLLYNRARVFEAFLDLPFVFGTLSNTAVCSKSQGILALGCRAKGDK